MGQFLGQYTEKFNRNNCLEDIDGGQLAGLFMDYLVEHLVGQQWVGELDN